MPNIHDNISYAAVGEKIVGVVAIEVTSLPFYKLFHEDDKESIEYVKSSFSVIIKEISSVCHDNSVCAELVWSCVPAINQSFASNINLTVLFRAVGLNKEDCKKKLDKLYTGFVTGVSALKTVTKFIDFDKYINVISKLDDNYLYAIRRTEEIMSFEASFFPYCYKYDAVSEASWDMDQIVNALMNEKNSAIIIQIIPTEFTQNEKLYLSQCHLSLGKIFQGINVPRFGFYRDTRAEKPFKTYKKYVDISNSPMLLMNILVSKEKTSSADIPFRISSLMTDNEGESSTSFQTIDLTSYRHFIKEVYTSPWIVYDAVSGFQRDNNIVNSQLGNYVSRLPFIYSPIEVSQVFRLPIGTKKITAGISIHDVDKRQKKFEEGVLNTADILVGKLQNVIGGENTYIGFGLNSLTKHMLVVGSPGSGKSTFSVGMLHRLWKNHRIPFLVIEPAKHEYRSLIDAIPELQVFSPGKNNVAPFVLNPFVPPKGVSVEKYKSIVKAAFSAAFEMWDPLGQLFDETLNICYAEQGWTNNTVADDSCDCFSLADFIKVYKEVVASKGYTGEYKKQIEAAGVLRFNGLIQQMQNIFDSRYSVPVEDILKYPTVIELSNIKDIRQKSFIIALLLNNIYAYVEANNVNDGMLKNVILLEEAHALICGEQQGESAVANQAAVNLLTNMLAEIRSMGVGIVVADQSPQKVTSSVISNTNIKLIFRLVEASEKDIVKGSTVMSDVQYNRLSNLQTGRAMLFFDKLSETEEVMTDNYRFNNGISTDLSDHAVKSRMVYWKTHGNLLKPYVDCDCIPLCEKNCNMDNREYARIIADRIFRINYPKVFNDLKTFAEFYKKINFYIQKETQAVFSNSVSASDIAPCVKVHLLRKLHYHTSIDLPFEKRKKTYETMKNG